MRRAILFGFHCLIACLVSLNSAVDAAVSAVESLARFMVNTVAAKDTPATAFVGGQFGGALATSTPIAADLFNANRHEAHVSRRSADRYT